MAKKQSTEERHRQVKQEHTKLVNTTEYGVQKYSDNYIIRLLAHRFYYSPTTIEKIVYARI